jgi:hypothetical protein
MSSVVGVGENASGNKAHVPIFFILSSVYSQPLDQLLD